MTSTDVVQRVGRDHLEQDGQFPVLRYGRSARARRVIRMGLLPPRDCRRYLDHLLASCHIHKPVHLIEHVRLSNGVIPTTELTPCLGPVVLLEFNENPSAVVRVDDEKVVQHLCRRILVHPLDGHIRRINLDLLLFDPLEELLESGASGVAVGGYLLGPRAVGLLGLAVKDLGSHGLHVDDAVHHVAASLSASSSSAVRFEVLDLAVLLEAFAVEVVDLLVQVHNLRVERPDLVRQRIALPADLLRELLHLRVGLQQLLLDILEGRHRTDGRSK